MVSSSLLAALARETSATAEPVEDLGALVRELVAGLPLEARAAAMSRAQAVDAAGQRLRGLAEVLAGLSRGEPETGVLAGLGLAGLAASLSGAVQEPSEPPSGDFTLFD